MTDDAVMTQPVMDELRKFVREKYKVADNDRDFSDEINLFDYGYVDSFGAVELIAFVENTFNIKIPESDLVICPLDSIRRIAEYVVTKQKNL
jgi:methoxymalonate biosynthesis acyl carrier protein